MATLFRAQRGKKRTAEEEGQQAREPVDGSQAAAAEDTQGKAKRKYVKSGRFVGKFNDYQKQKQARADQAGQASGKKRSKRTAGETIHNTAVRCSMLTTMLHASLSIQHGFKKSGCLQEKSASAGCSLQFACLC